LVSSSDLLHSQPISSQLTVATMLFSSHTSSL
jgi:hypothetical protein